MHLGSRFLYKRKSDPFIVCLKCLAFDVAQIVIHPNSFILKIVEVSGCNLQSKHIIVYH